MKQQRMRRPTNPVQRLIEDDSIDGPLRLCGAVIVCAMEDAQRGDADAAEWLAGPECLNWIGFLPFAEPETIQAAIVSAACPTTLEKMAA